MGEEVLPPRQFFSLCSSCPLLSLAGAAVGININGHSRPAGCQVILPPQKSYRSGILFINVCGTSQPLVVDRLGLRGVVLKLPLRGW